MDLNTMITLGLCVVILIILVVMYLKDKQADKKFERFEQVLTDNMQENFILKKEIEKNTKEKNFLKFLKIRVKNL